MLSARLLILFLCGMIMSSRAQEKFLIKNNRKSDKIKFEMVNNLMIVPVELNGTQLSFLVDTGVKTSVLLTLNKEDTLLLKNAEKIFLKGIGGEELIEAYRSVDNKFTLGKTTHPGLSLYVIFDENINFSPRLGVPVHGIIGYDLFKDFIVEINYSRNFFRLHDPDRFKKRLRGYSRLPLQFHQEKPYVEVDVEIDGMEARANLLLDNGLSDALWLFPDDDKIHVPEKTYTDFLGMGLLGDVIGERGLVGSIKIGEEVLENIPASFPDSLSVQDLKTYRARNGSIGAETLRRFHLIFDYKNQSLYLRGNKDRQQAFSFDMSGIILEHSGFKVIESYEEVVSSILSKSENQNEIIMEPSFFKKFELKPAFKIARLRENAPAMSAGLKVGDEVLKINRRNAWKMELDDFTKIFSSGAGETITMEVLRKGRRFNYQFRLENPFQ
ncbi:retropepsin-like aspartic protease [Salinimicrobium sp. HB62]|uniref:retropepsin-like aspartic protease n=1 Tax=Salinimicrobium sp. HB62 TaxID=3077781 RepID=UPI002D77B34C|nr:aspartyl protease family protein [Salinimicrobium sp. HB62]